MLLRSGRIENKMANNKLTEPPKEIEPVQENLDFEEERGLPTSEINFCNVNVRQSLPRSNT